MKFPILFARGLLLAPLLLLQVECRVAVVVVSTETIRQTSYVGIRNDDDQNRQTPDDVSSDIDCIDEANLDFSHVDLVSSQQVESKTLRSCASHCLSDHPDRSHLLIAYQSRPILSDRFVCICADEEAFANRTKVLPLSRCDRRCPDDGSYRCGDAGDDVLSVYCLERGCLPREERVEPVCAARMPHDPHGCVAAAGVNWAHAHNVRNFSAAVNNDTACIWECHDHHPSAMYSLTRCGYPRSFAPNKLVKGEFCNMFDDDAPFYTVNCVTDLDEDGGDPKRQNATCRSYLPEGCIFEDFVSNSTSSHAITVDSPEGAADPQLCHATCFSVFGAAASHVAVRWDADANAMRCLCLKPGAFEADMVGPEVACDIPCQPEGTGLMCGGPAEVAIDRPPALTLYCLHKGLKESVEDVDDDDKTWTLYGSQSILVKLHHAMHSENIAGDVMVGLLTLLCIILLSIVVYLCVSRGVMSLSRQAM